MSNPSIPANFPRPSTSSALSGAHPKLALVEVDGAFVMPGARPSELLGQYELCEDLSQQMTSYCRRKLAEKAVPDEAGALLRGFSGLCLKNWCSDEHNRWIIARTAELLGWPLPSLPPLTRRRLYEVEVDDEYIETLRQVTRPLTQTEELILHAHEEYLRRAQAASGDGAPT